jgi:hypothetical protein
VVSLHHLGLQSFPYSHPDAQIREQRFQAACAIAAGLLLDGHHVYSPVVSGHPLVRYGLSAEWSFWEQLDRQHLERCDEVVVLMLDGWRESIGVQAELRHASVLGKPVRYVEADESPKAEASRPSATSHRGLYCLACGSDRLRVVYTRDKSGGVVQRRRECRDCKRRATTWERAVPAAR